MAEEATNEIDIYALRSFNRTPQGGLCEPGDIFPVGEVRAAELGRLGLARPATDADRKAISRLDIVEITRPGFEHGLVALPYTFSLHPDLTIHRVYNGWWFVGRPTLEELRQDLRAIMERCRPDYLYRPPGA